MNIIRQIRNQQRVIDSHGSNLAGYIRRYGEPGTSYCYGSGGPALYAADIATLIQLQLRFDRKRYRLSGGR